MSTAAAVPETWELSGDDAWETLRTTGRARLAGDAFRRFRAADGTSHARSMAFVSMLIVIQGVIIMLGLASAIGQGNLTDLILRREPAPIETTSQPVDIPPEKWIATEIAPRHLQRLLPSIRFAAN